MPVVLFALVVAWAVMLLFGGMDLDRGLLAFFYAGDGPPELRTAARILTEIGGHKVLLALTFAASAFLLVRRRFRPAILLVAITCSGRALVDLQKLQTARLRPVAHEHLVDVQTLSFPSGHAANSVMVYVCLAVLMTTTYPQRSLAVWAAVWLAILIGLSRLVLGVHWPSDVIAGWAFGLFWTLLLLRLSGHDIGDGPPRVLRDSSLRRSEDTTGRNDVGADRAETARELDDKGEGSSRLNP